MEFGRAVACPNWALRGGRLFAILHSSEYERATKGNKDRGKGGCVPIRFGLPVKTTALIIGATIVLAVMWFAVLYVIGTNMGPPIYGFTKSATQYLLSHEKYASGITYDATQRLLYCMELSDEEVDYFISSENVGIWGLLLENDNFAKSQQIVRTYNGMTDWQKMKLFKIAKDNGDASAMAIIRAVEGVNRGSVRELGWNLVRASHPVRASEQNNRLRFERRLKEISKGLSDGESIEFYDYFDAVNTDKMFTEMYYSSGTFVISSYGKFDLKRTGCLVEIRGSVEHRWRDDYDWQPELYAYLSTAPNVKCCDSPPFNRLPLPQGPVRDDKVPKSFKINSFWCQKLEATYIIRSYMWDHSVFSWSEPFSEEVGVFKRYGRTTSEVSVSRTSEGR